jgi:hypothetical protein
MVIDKKEYKKNWAANNKEKMRQYRKKYILKNKEKVKLYQRKYYLENREKLLKKIFLNDGEIVVNEQAFNDLLEQKDKHKQSVLKLIKFLEEQVENGNIRTINIVDEVRDIIGDFNK